MKSWTMRAMAGRIMGIRTESRAGSPSGKPRRPDPPESAARKTRDDRRAEGERRLREKGLRVTGSRVEVLALFLRSSRPLSLFDLREALGKGGAGHEESTLFRCLESFAKKGILEEVSLPDPLSPGHAHAKRSFYTLAAAQVPERHDHIVCRDCRSLGHFHLDLPEALLRQVEERSGFRVLGHALQLSGLCPACRSSGSA